MVLDFQWGVWCHSTKLIGAKSRNITDATMPNIKASGPEVKIQNPELGSEAPCGGYTRYEALWNGTQTSPLSGEAEL